MVPNKAQNLLNWIEKCMGFLLWIHLKWLIFQKIHKHINCLNQNTLKYRKQVRINERHFSAYLGIYGLWVLSKRKEKNIHYMLMGFLIFADFSVSTELVSYKLSFMLNRYISDYSCRTVPWKQSKIHLGLKRIVL